MNGKMKASPASGQISTQLMHLKDSYSTTFDLQALFDLTEQLLTVAIIKIKQYSHFTKTKNSDTVNTPTASR